LKFHPLAGYFSSVVFYFFQRRFIPCRVKFTAAAARKRRNHNLLAVRPVTQAARWERVKEFPSVFPQLQRRSVQESVAFLARSDIFDCVTTRPQSDTP
jgi:hypothetical protein